MTYRERQEAKAERLRGWAQAREAKQSGLNQAARADEATTGIPFGQPILIGHHSERRHRAAIKRMDNAMSASIDNSRKAASMSSRADSIEAAADAAIYSDDHDAIERLEEKLAGLEAERERIKAYNKTCRKRAKLDLAELTEEQRTEWAADIKAAGLTKGELSGLMSSIQHQAYQCPGGRFPAYALTNLGGRISTGRKRLERLKREKANGGPADRIICARFTSSCETCGAELEKGSTIRFNRQDGARCHTCPTTEETA
jgi:hypothetical protein